MRCVVIGCLFSVVQFSCGAPHPRPRLEITVSGPASKQLTISDGTRLLGRTSSEGVLSIEAALGHRYELRAACPGGFMGDVAKVVIPEANPPALTRVTVRCRETQSIAVVLVAVEGGAGLPISVDGVEVGVTNSEGFLHLRLQRPAGTGFEVAVRGSKDRSVDPDSMVQVFRLESEDALFVFETRVEPTERPKIQRPVRPRRRAPYRLR